MVEGRTLEAEFRGDLFEACRGVPSLREEARSLLKDLAFDKSPPRLTPRLD